MTEETPPISQKPRTVGEAVGSITLITATACTGCAIAIAGSLGPWATSPLSSAAGINGDGKITLAIAVVGLLLIWGSGMRNASAAVFAGVVGVGLAALGIYEIGHIHHRLAGVRLFGQQIDHVGWGVYAVAAGGALTTLTALRELFSRPATAHA